MTIWRNKLASGRTAEDGGVVDWGRARRYCREAGLVGVGYGVAGLEDGATLESVLDHWRAAGWGTQPVNTIRALATRTNKGDHVWTRDGSSYWLGCVTGDWRYDASEGAREFDLYNVRDCEWLTVPFDGWTVPGAVVRSFSGRGTTLQRVISDPAARMTDLLWRQATDPSIARDPVDATDVLTSLLDPIDVEDVVLLFLQYQGWLLMPSTRTNDTPVYEAAFRYRADGHTAIVSVKSGHSKVPLAKLAAAAGGGHAFAFSTEGAFEGRPVDFDVEIIDVATIIRFMEEHASLLPMRVAQWLA
jgi:hypothetical protein